MKKFGIEITGGLDIFYNHYLSDDCIKSWEKQPNGFKHMYPLSFHSRRFDKPAGKLKSGSYFWWLDDEPHRIGKPAVIWGDGSVQYFENGEEIK